MKHCKTPCKECPFARHTAPGTTGGADPTVYIGQALGPFLLSCHMDPNYEKDPRSPELMQCAGAATFRSNIGVADLMPPFLHHLPLNEEKVFSNPAELLSHHLGIPIEKADAFLVDRPPHELLRIELEKSGVRRVVPPTKMEATMGEYAEEKARLQQAEKIAKVCHEANRVLTELVKDVPVQPAWNDAPEEMRRSSIEGVLFAFDNPEADGKSRHNSWKEAKIRDGWTFGDVKDPDKKTHPSIVEYEKLSEGTKAKDFLFGAIVKAMTT